MNSPSQDYGGKSNWGFFLTVPICLILIVYFLTTGLKSEDRQAAAVALKPAWYTPRLRGVTIWQTSPWWKSKGNRKRRSTQGNCADIENGARTQGLLSGSRIDMDR